MKRLYFWPLQVSLMAKYGGVNGTGESFRRPPASPPDKLIADRLAAPGVPVTITRPGHAYVACAVRGLLDQERLVCTDCGALGLLVQLPAKTVIRARR